MGRFDAVRAAKPGDTTAEVVIDLKGYVPRTGMSDNLPAGYYGFEYRVGAYQPKKDRPKERNHEWTAVVVEPAEYAGLKVISRNPAPDDSDPKNVGLDFFTRLVWGCWQALSKGAQAEKAGPRKYSPKWFVGKKFFAKTKTGTGEYAEVGEIDRILSAEEWAACKKGPLPVTGGAPRSPRQTETPDLDDAGGEAEDTAEESKTSAGGDALDDLMTE